MDQCEAPFHGVEAADSIDLAPAVTENIVSCIQATLGVQENLTPKGPGAQQRVEHVAKSRASQLGCALPVGFRLRDTSLSEHATGGNETLDGAVDVSGIIGPSEVMQRLRARIAKVARSEVTVLITGETGTGKERVAETLHRVSARNQCPLVAINCAAVPDSLLESELFGYERGAFTGAQTAYAGKLRMASGGTVLLDEIGEMSAYGQAKLLRVLESREVYPLGGDRLARLDVRFVAATNQDLECLVRENRFRKDLYYRLNVAQLVVPPLRDHKEDIPALLDHYVGELNRRHNGHVGKIRPELLDSMLEYDWPGNIRELKNLLEAVFIDPPAGDFGLRDMPDSFQRIFTSHVTRRLDERERLVSVLEATNWNKSQAAVELKWSRMTLYRKLSKYRISSTRH